MTTAIKPTVQLAPMYQHQQLYEKGLPAVRATPYPTNNQLPFCFSARPYIGMYQTFGGHPFIFPPITHPGTLPIHDMLPFDKYMAARHPFMQHQEPKPNHSYIALIAMAIMNSPDKKLILSGIYQYILDNYPYFRTRGPGWRNSIRHNLSLNDCFVKISRSANGKGHFWAIHPANFYDFSKGDFRRRRAQRQVRKHLGLLTEDEDESPCASPEHSSESADDKTLDFNQLRTAVQYTSRTLPDSVSINYDVYCNGSNNNSNTSENKIRRKRMFDIESLLAPNDVYADTEEEKTSPKKVKLSTDELYDKMPESIQHKGLAIKTEDCDVTIKVEQ